MKKPEQVAPKVAEVEALPVPAAPMSKTKNLERAAEADEIGLQSAG
ncbi:MAG: hypothetical protein KKF30_16225 [Proteobacteria bacterium]|nr:hypothetical protein [Pseudomonadota bacterium]MBU4472028.1 hypothetical protein [Pseudomonadota bacterium]